MENDPAAFNAALLKSIHEANEYQRTIAKTREEGLCALKRLLPIAQGYGGQARIVTAFLLGLYNGRRFPFDLTDFRSLDYRIFCDCLLLLRMDYQPQREIHEHIKNGGQLLEKLAEDWNIPDRTRAT